MFGSKRRDLKLYFMVTSEIHCALLCSLWKKKQFGNIEGNRGFPKCSWLFPAGMMCEMCGLSSKCVVESFIVVQGLWKMGKWPQFCPCCPIVRTQPPAFPVDDFKKCCFVCCWRLRVNLNVLCQDFIISMFTHRWQTLRDHLKILFL